MHTDADTQPFSHSAFTHPVAIMVPKQNIVVNSASHVIGGDVRLCTNELCTPYTSAIMGVNAML